MPLREVLSRWAIVPRRRFGQNFLHDPAVAVRVADAAGAGPGDHVLEIGPGLGALTRPLLGSGARVTAIEVDRRIADYLEEELGVEERFTLVRGDVLESDLDRIAPDARILVGNLPYSITGPVLALLIERADRLDRAVVMVQKEVGIRLTAGSGGRDLGAPAVLLRLLYRVERICEVGRGAFQPAPDVVSVVLRLEALPGARLAPELRDAVNRAYRQRRKMIRKTLKGELAPEESISEALVSIGHSSAARPEELEPEDWPRLLSSLRAGDKR